MKKLTYIKALVILLLGIITTSCDQDESVPDIPRYNSTKAEIKEKNITITEGDNLSFTIVQDDLIEEKLDAQEFYDFVSGQIGVRVIGGTATEGLDYTFNIPTIHDVSFFLLQDGYYYGYDASVSLENIVDNIITIKNDSITEGSETIELEFFPVGIASVIINDKLTITIND